MDAPSSTGDELWKSRAAPGSVTTSPETLVTTALPDGNLLYTMGSASQVQEVAPDGTVVWHLTFDDDYKEDRQRREMMHRPQNAGQGLIVGVP